MEITKKLEKLENLDFQEIADLTVSIFEKIGYTSFTVQNERCITGNVKVGLTNSNHGFVLFKEAYTGSKAAQDFFSNTLKDNSGKYNFHTCYVISTQNISKGFKRKINLNISLEYIDRDLLCTLIDEHLPNFWNHQNIELLEYEKFYLDNILKENELKRLKISERTYDKLLTIFIEPRIYQLKEDKESNIPMQVKFDSKKILNIDTPAIISGDTGAGKSTFLKKIGESCILATEDDLKDRKIPIFISTIDLIANNYDIISTINSNLNGFFNGNYLEAIKSNKVLLLIDSIDEFDKKVQRNILEDLEVLTKNKRINYFIATRHLDNGFANFIKHKISYFNIEKFNNHQIKHFITKFFPHGSRAENLINALKENRILERLPITPLSISLISILFEEKNFEIPATISDIYDNFNQLLLGKGNVESRFEFIDINFKERILSLYALEIMSRKNKVPMTKEEFLIYFEVYFKNKTQPLPDNQLEEFLLFLVENTGILFLKNGTYVQFKHDSFMEYYCAIEIFKHNREKEELLIENFFDLNWQNSAIFYGGKSRDMEKFLEKITEKVKKANNLNNYFSGVMGLGYLLQALYQTNNQLRKESLLVALDINVKSYELLTKIASDEQIVTFKNLKLPFLAMLNMFFFFENFNSVTIKTPLELAFEDIYEAYITETSDTTKGYKALKLALTLNSSRINSDVQLEKLIDNSAFLNNPFLLVLADMGVTLFKGSNYNELKKEIGKKLKGGNEVASYLLETPAKKLRFTGLDLIRSKRKVCLYTEGKTDVEIIEHAFMKLTHNTDPYWSIKPSGYISGGATELNAMLMKCVPMVEKEEIVVGIFDNDAKGINEFNRLDKNLYQMVEGSQRIKKHVAKNIYALKLPIPPFRSQYLKDDQVYNYFCIEHYFSDNILKEKGMIKETIIPDIFEINHSSSAKNKFSAYLRKIEDPKVFDNFVYLFREIDRLADVKEIDYDV